MEKGKISRRSFFSATACAASAVSLGPLGGFTLLKRDDELARHIMSPRRPVVIADRTLNLAPAKWIWYPAKRILPNTFFHFRKEFRISKKLLSAKGWIVGDSRYLLFCNGKRIQFGPAPSDPRFTEADPVDLTAHLATGENVIGATVLYYGFGDGTWPAGKAGFIMKLELTYDDGTSETIVSDATWQSQLARSWQPGMYKRWYLRALQESFDNRNYPHGWNAPGYKTDSSWKTSVITGSDADKPALNTSIPDYLFDSGLPSASQLRGRSIPLIKEKIITASRMAEAHYINWHTRPEEYFDVLTEDSFTADSQRVNVMSADDGVILPVAEGKGLVVTYEMQEQVVGWPFLSIEAAEGTTIELMVQQGHEPFGKGGPALMNNNLHSWTRFICRTGTNELMTFDFESVKWIQLHIRGTNGSVVIRQAGVLRRLYDFENVPVLSTSDQKLQKLFNASFNTVLNNSQDTIVDCMGRERQQYSGDIGHVVHVLHRGYGESRLPARYINTFSQGLTIDGFFMDSWPAYDRLNRIGQRQLDLTPWGPLLDHSVAFNYDVWYHYLYTGKKQDLEEVYPRLVHFFRYLKSRLGEKPLFEVENLGVPAIWMDSDSYKRQRHKQCAYNLYVAGMLQDAFSNLCKVFNEESLREESLEMAERLVRNVRKTFFSATEGLLVNNLPWYREENEVRTCERSLAHFILGNFGSPQELDNAANELIKSPARLGKCYPPNAQWRHWALAATGNIQPVIDELRDKWYALTSVHSNNTMPEVWNVVPDDRAQYSHASIAPLYAAYMCFAGISVLEPGGRRIKIFPQPGDINDMAIGNFTGPAAAVTVKWKGLRGKRKFEITVPAGTAAEVWIDNREKVTHKLLGSNRNYNIYLLPAGTSQFQLKFT